MDLLTPTEVFSSESGCEKQRLEALSQWREEEGCLGGAWVVMATSHGRRSPGEWGRGRGLRTKRKMEESNW